MQSSDHLESLYISINKYTVILTGYFDDYLIMDYIV